MITRLTHSFIYVLDLNESVKFYTGILGFKLNTDITVNGERWVTIEPPQQPGLQILLMPVEESMIFKAWQAHRMQELIKKEVLSFGVFECKNLLALYEELKMKGVQFCIEPYQNKHLNKYEAAFFDNSGNWFRLTEAQN